MLFFTAYYLSSQANVFAQSSGGRSLGSGGGGLSGVTSIDMTVTNASPAYAGLISESFVVTIFFLGKDFFVMINGNLICPAPHTCTLEPGLSGLTVDTGSGTVELTVL